jgi:TolB protein
MSGSVHEGASRPRSRFAICLGASLILAATLLLTSRPLAQQPPAPTPAPQQPADINTTISSDQAGAPPRFAIPDFIPLSNDPEVVDVAQTIGRVLWDDINFEREFALIPRDVYASIPVPRSLNEVPLERWNELNADGLIIGTVQRTETGVRVEARLFNVRTRQSAFAKEYTGAVTSKRLFAHQIADEVHQQQRAVRGVARTKLAFNSDRDGERLGGTVESRGVKEIYIADYDGEGQRRVTTQRSLNITPTWSPDGRSIAYTSYRRGPPNIFISNIYQGTLEELTKGSMQSVTPVWSPDGTRLAYSSTRDGSGNFEIYVANRDGSNVRRLTNSPSADITPTWSPTGTQVAFTSDRTGTPQVYIVGADGLGLRQATRESYADRPTWSPAPYNELAFAAQTGPGFDIKVLELATGQIRQLTFGEGTNESPAFAPNGRHLAFSSTRAGKSQIFSIARDGRDLRQLTRVGNNQQPNWSN